jgi:hypothetical protein
MISNMVKKKRVPTINQIYRCLSKTNTVKFINSQKKNLNKIKSTQYLKKIGKKFVINAIKTFKSRIQPKKRKKG